MDGNHLRGMHMSAAWSQTQGVLQFGWSRSLQSVKPREQARTQVGRCEGGVNTRRCEVIPLLVAKQDWVEHYCHSYK